MLCCFPHIPYLYRRKSFIQHSGFRQLRKRRPHALLFLVGAFITLRKSLSITVVDFFDGRTHT